MYSYEIALEMVTQSLDDCLDDMTSHECKLSVSSEGDYDFGWVFFYAYLDSNGTVIKVAGNASLIFEKETGKIISTGTAYPTNYYIQMYLLTGDPHSDLRKHVKITGWEDGARAISAIKALREHTNLGLAAAKTIVESGLAREQPIFEALTLDNAHKLVVQLAKRGFTALCSPKVD